MNSHISRCIALIAACGSIGSCAHAVEDKQRMETYPELVARLKQESEQAYRDCPFSALSRDYFARFVRDPDVHPASGDVEITGKWRIVVAKSAGPVAELMATHLEDFLGGRMGAKVSVERLGSVSLADRPEHAIVLLDSGGGDAAVPASFAIAVERGGVTVSGVDKDGLRDGVVKLVELIGLRRAPVLAEGTHVYRPRVPVRLGAKPWLGSYRDVLFTGYNATFVPGGDLFALSTSDAIPELAARRKPERLQELAAEARDAATLGLKTYCWLDTRQKFPKDDPVLAAHPEIRGALTWKADGEYNLCTEHPLVKRYLSESVEGIFRAAPGLSGIVIIIGGEGFYHCFMRSYNTAIGHTNCARCEPIGAERVVANLCGYLAEAARKVNPRAEVIAWPYSAQYVWSKDQAQVELMKLLAPGTGIFTEIEKDQNIDKPEAVKKHIWDYSIDFIGPSDRAKAQMKACREAGVPIYLKSESELAFEAPRLPSIPCIDRWLDRAEALASSGANGAWVFPAFRPMYGSTSAEVYKLLWWDPVPDREALIQQLAARIAGAKAGPRLRQAWKRVSEAIAWSPELPAYYTGPYYLGPAHPMCADPSAAVPQVFQGRYLFRAEISDDEGMKLQPTYVTSPSGDVPVFGRFYAKMAALMKQADDELRAAEPLVPQANRATFGAEASPIRWLYHTTRTEASFYESCQLRDGLLALAALKSRTARQVEEARGAYDRWLAVLNDEKVNTVEALPVAEADMRLDWYYGGDHSFPHASQMLKAKLELIELEITRFLPSLRPKLGLE